MYALIISTNRRNKEPKKKGPTKIKKQIQGNKTKPGGKNHKTQKKITKGGQPGGCVKFSFGNEKHKY